MSPSWPVRPLLERGDAAAPVADASAVESPSPWPTPRWPSPNSSSSMPSSVRPLTREVAAAGEAHRVAAGGPVEGLGDRRPPVDDDRLLALVGDREAADVEALVASALGSRSMRPNTSAASPRSSWVSRLTHRLVEHVALVAGLVGAAAPDLGQSAQPKCELTGPFEAVVGVVDVGLLCGEIGVLRHRPSRGFKGGNSHEGENNRSGAGRKTYGTMAR